jgi:hypothetical protein
MNTQTPNEYLIHHKEITEMSAKRLTPIKAIRAKCLDCSNYLPSQVRECRITDCPLWPYRMGTNPARKGKGGNICKNMANLPKIPASTNDLATN